MAKQSFEKSLKQLEDIVQELESGDLALEKAIKLFEEGISLSKHCSDTLDQMEKKITILLKDQDGSILEKPFEPENDTSSDQ
ncbi:MAG: exodeoxyribonuclease VII small subunit [Desulfobacterales bacterium]|nr:exodeoxyribonuclease VII small subunit [Desulfobacterales bacterium]